MSEDEQRVEAKSKDAPPDSTFFIVENFILERIIPLLGRNELRVFLALLRFKNVKTGICFPSRARIAALVGIDERQVSAAVRRLRALNIMSVRRTSKRFGFRNVYTLHPKRCIYPKNSDECDTSGIRPKNSDESASIIPSVDGGGVKTGILHSSEKHAPAFVRDYRTKNRRTYEQKEEETATPPPPSNEASGVAEIEEQKKNQKNFPEGKANRNQSIAGIVAAVSSSMNPPRHRPASPPRLAAPVGALGEKEFRDEFNKFLGKSGNDGDKSGKTT